MWKSSSKKKTLLVYWYSLHTLSPVKHLITTSNKAQVKLLHQQPPRIQRPNIFLTLQTCQLTAENRQSEPRTMNSQMSDTRTIALSSSSQRVGVDSSDEFYAYPENFEQRTWQPSCWKYSPISKQCRNMTSTCCGIRFTFLKLISLKSSLQTMFRHSPPSFGELLQLSLGRSEIWQKNKAAEIIPVAGGHLWRMDSK